MKDYLLTFKDGCKERWSVREFNTWVSANMETIGSTFETRLDQFRRYTGQNVVDWEMVED